jgi:hypothetical protein
MSNEVLNHLTAFSVGDTKWSDHSRVITYVYQCNLTNVQLKQAYEQAKDLYNLDIRTECRDDSILSEDFVRTITKLGVTSELLNQHLDYYSDTDSTCAPDSLYSAVFIGLYMEIARLVEPKLQWQEADIYYTSLGGAGLYAD